MFNPFKQANELKRVKKELTRARANVVKLLFSSSNQTTKLLAYKKLCSYGDITLTDIQHGKRFLHIGTTSVSERILIQVEDKWTLLLIDIKGTPFKSTNMGTVNSKEEVLYYLKSMENPESYRVLVTPKES